MATAVVEVPSESVCNTAAATMLLEYIKSHNQPLTYKQWQRSMLVTANARASCTKPCRSCRPARDLKQQATIKQSQQWHSILNSALSDDSG